MQEDARVCVHWSHSSHMHLSYLGQVSLFFHILSSLRAHCREWLQSDGRWTTDILPGHLSDSSVHAGGLQSLITVTSLYTDMARNAPFVTNLGCMMWSPFAFLLPWYKEPCLHSNVQYLRGSFLSNSVWKMREKDDKRKEQWEEGKGRKRRKEKEKNKKTTGDQVWIKDTYIYLC